MDRINVLFYPIWYYVLTFAHKITPMTEFEVIKRFVDVDGTNKMIWGVRGIVRIY